MLRQCFGNPTGRITVYLILFISFLSFSAYVYTADVPSANTSLENQKLVHGKIIWQDHNCAACHQFYGLGGYLGPDLTNVISEKGEPYARAIIMGGTGTMPNFELADHEIDALIEFLKHADQSGKTDRSYFRIDAAGQIYGREDE